MTKNEKGVVEAHKQHAITYTENTYKERERERERAGHKKYNYINKMDKQIYKDYTNLLMDLVRAKTLYPNYRNDLF